jgi:leucyl-tRNA synthetase
MNGRRHLDERPPLPGSGYLEDYTVPMARILITSAIPYINGIKHLGNLVGSQLPADLYARYMRARGHEVLFLCATDEHGTPAELAAAKAGKPVAEYCAEMWACRPSCRAASGSASTISAARRARRTTR